MRGGVIILAGVVLGALGPATAAEDPPKAVHPKVSFRTPLPAWVEPLSPNLEAVPPKDNRGGIHWLLRDTQGRVGQGEDSRYVHIARRFTTGRGVQDNSELSFGFDPAFETLELHFIRIIRDGVVRDVLDPMQVRVIQRESSLDRQLYDGRLEAILFPADVRAGDVIEYAWTVTGHNPALGPHHIFRAGLGGYSEFAELRVSVLWTDPAPARPWQHLAAAPTVEAVEGGTRYLWRLSPAPGTEPEPGLPDWVDPFPWIQVTSFTSWSDVARWATPLFASPGDLPDDALALVETWKEEPDPVARATAAARFVQDEVRYLGIEIGPQGLIPHKPHETFSRRFGDCKDKAWLLATLLRALDVPAQPVLVDTDTRRALDDEQPSPYAFNHAIARVELPEGPVFVDATMSHQAGPLDANPPVPYERALIVDPSTTGLTNIEGLTLSVPERRVSERFFVDDEGKGELRVETTLTHRAANGFRYELDSSGLQSLGDDYRKFYATRFDNVETVTPFEVADDPENNRVVVKEHYALTGFWKNDGRTLDPWLVRDWLSKPSSEARTEPLAVTHPVHVSHTVIVETPGVLETDVGNEVIDSEAFVVTTRSIESPGRVGIQATYRSKAEQVSPADYVRHRGHLSKARDAIRPWVEAPVNRGGPTGTLVAVVGGILLLIMAYVAGVFFRDSIRAWARRFRFARRKKTSAGESPGDPLEVLRVESDLLVRAVLPLKCVCRKKATFTFDAAPEALNFDGGVVHIVRISCGACGHERPLYIKGTRE